jgi:hypothetical protein
MSTSACPKAKPGRRGPTMAEQLAARVRRDREALLRLMRQGGRGALHSALSGIIENAAQETRAGAGAMSDTDHENSGMVEEGGGSGSAAAALPRSFSYDDEYDGLSRDEYIELLVHLETVLREEEAAAEAQGAAQAAEVEAFEQAVLEHDIQQLEGDAAVSMRGV